MSRFRSKRPKLLLLLEFLIYRFFEVMFQFFPPKWVDLAGRCFGKAAFFLMPRRRSIVERNCRIAWGNSLSLHEIKKLTAEIFVRNGANLLGGIRCMVMSDSELHQHLSMEGEEQIQAYLRQGKNGVIFVLCHMGNWEVLARVASLISPNTPAAAFYRPLNNPWMNNMTKRRRQRSGMKLLSNKEGFTQSLPLLRAGGMLGILADQHAGRTGTRATFFGRPTACSPLAEVLHRRTGAAIFYIAVYRDAPAHWHIKISSHSPTAPVETPHIMKGIEQSLSLSPADGFWFHDRWKQYKRALLNDPHARDSLDRNAITQPRRWLFVGSLDPKIHTAATDAMHHAIDHSDDAQVDIIGITPSTNLRGTWHKHSKNLAVQISELANQSKNPLDLIIYFCSVDEIPDQLDISYSFVTAGISFHKSQKLSVLLPTNDPLTDESTWWKFLAHLGLKKSDEIKE